MRLLGTLALVCAVIGCSGSPDPSDADGGPTDGGSRPADRRGEIMAVCDQFAADGCPIGMPLGYGEDCAAYFAILDRRSSRTGCEDQNRAWFACLREQTCSASMNCADLDAAADACRAANPGGDTCLAACQRSMTAGCSVTVSGCNGWCTRQEAEGVLAGCTVEGEALDDCRAGATDICAAATCATEAATFASCVGG